MNEKEIDEITKTLEKQDLIPFLSDLEKHGYSIVNIIPIYHLVRLGKITRLRSVLTVKNRYGVMNASDLKKQIDKWGDTPSCILLSPAGFYSAHVFIHSPGPNFDGNYKVNTFEHDYRTGLKNFPVSVAFPKELMKYLK